MQDAQTLTKIYGIDKLVGDIVEASVKEPKID